MTTALPKIPSSYEHAPLSFDDWKPSSNGFLYAPFQSINSAIKLKDRINSLVSSNNALAELSIRNDHGKFTVLIQKDKITEECIAKLPELKILTKFYVVNPDVLLWNEEEIEDNNSRRSVINTEEMLIKLSNQFENAQKKIEEKAYNKVDFLLPLKERKCQAGYQITNHTEELKLNLEGQIAECLFPCGGAGTMGDHYKQMEDATLVTVIEIEVDDAKRTFPLYAIFDGHAGSTCSNFLKEKLENYLQQKLFEIYLLPSDERELALYNMFKVSGVDLTRLFLYSQGTANEGSTMVFAIVIDQEFWVINVGDSRAVISIEGYAIALSEDADLSCKKYQDGVIKRRALIIFHNEVHRVNGIAMGRAVGHVEYEGINPRATIVRYPLNEHPGTTQHLILASDGVWDVASSKEAATFVYQQFQLGLSNHDIAHALVKRSFDVGSQDNISALIISLPSS